MDLRLTGWARATARRCGPGAGLPRLWLFTDPGRLADPLPAVARLPRGLAGVVLRHDGDPNRAALGRDIARLCRARRLHLVVAGDARLAAALHAGVHLRAGFWPGSGRCHWPQGRSALVTSSAHGPAELRRARRAGADLVFLSPAFATASHPGAVGLGAIRWSRFARSAGVPVAALGGIDGMSIRRLPRGLCAAAAAIGALA